MKKLLFLLILIGVSMQAGGQEKEKGYITRFGEWMDDADKKCECAACPKSTQRVICPDTPIQDIQRPSFEIELRLDGFEAPAGGKPQFSAGNFSVVVWHSFSSVFQIYGSYGGRQIDKIEYEGSVYDKSWTYQTITAGAAFYLRPTLKLFVGLGKIVPKNSEGQEELSYALERGVAWDIPLNNMGYKIGVSFRSIEASLADDNAHITESQAEASTNIVAISLIIPIGY